MNKWTQGVFYECYDVQNMAHHGTILSAASLPASISASQIHDSRLVLLDLQSQKWMSWMSCSDTHVTAKNDTFILSIRFSMLSADSWLGFQSHKLRMRLHVSLHLFTTDSSHIHQSNLWSSSKSGSGLRVKNEQNECKWAKWERNIWEIWANYEKQMMLKKIMKRKSPNNQL